MPITLMLSKEAESFIREQVASGNALDESDLMEKALRLYQQLKARRDELRSQVQSSIINARNGQSALLDVDGLVEELQNEFVQGSTSTDGAN